MSWLQKLVSGTRRRYKEEGYDIDLSYICQDRIIVMSFPASGM
jgi:phosphatidylinositol-3,4,5-trisphosphate 3-phosphatase/dual-specificity protein phosphatase PTEN